MIWSMETSSASSIATLLRAGRLVDGQVVDVVVVDGIVTSVEPSRGTTPTSEFTIAQTYDLDGWMLLGAFAEPHAHLDKALSAGRAPNHTGDLEGAIAGWVGALERGVLTPDDVTERATKALQKLLTHGVTAVRTHVDVGGPVGASFVAAVDAARKNLGDAMTVQLCGLVHSPIAGEDGAANRAALDLAIENGLDVIGGCSYREDDVDGVLDELVGRANDTGLPLDLHVDETLDPTVLTLDTIAKRVLDGRIPEQVGASHCVSLVMQDESTQAEVSARVAEAKVGIVTLPQTNLYLQGRDHQRSMPRALTAIHALEEAGARLCAGADNVQDPFNPVGRSDPLETAALMVMAGHRSAGDSVELVSARVRTHMGLAPAGPFVGGEADLVAIDADTLGQAVADAPPSRKVFRRGRLVAESRLETQLY